MVSILSNNPVCRTLFSWLFMISFSTVTPGRPSWHRWQQWGRRRRRRRRRYTNPGIPEGPRRWWSYTPRNVQFNPWNKGVVWGVFFKREDGKRISEQWYYLVLLTTSVSWVWYAWRHPFPVSFGSMGVVFYVANTPSPTQTRIIFFYFSLGLGITATHLTATWPSAPATYSESSSMCSAPAGGDILYP